MELIIPVPPLKKLVVLPLQGLIISVFEEIDYKIVERQVIEASVFGLPVPGAVQ